MKRLFILLGIIGVIHVTAGSGTAVKLVNPKKEINNNYSVGLLSLVTPLYTHLEGNLFLAIKTAGQLEVEDGDVVEFIFDKNTSHVSFHVNEINQDLINTGDASLFVMVHNDLALSLRAHRLRQINVKHDDDIYSLIVNKFWTPDQYMTSR